MNVQTVAPPFDFSLADISVLGNEILDKLKDMRRADPIFWSEQNQVWEITGHEECAEAFRGHLPLSVFRMPHMTTGRIPEAERTKRLPYMYETTRHWILNLDAPDHPRLRRLMMKAFSRSIVEGLRPAARGFVQEALDEAGQLGDVEFVSTVARKIPARTILRQLGIEDDSLVPKLHRWSVVMNTAFSNVNAPVEILDECEQVLLTMREIFLAEIEKRRARPTEDFLSALVTARDGTDQLHLEEMLGMCYITLIAGHDTTANTIALGTAALSQHPEARDFLRANPGKTAEAVMELMRYIAMTTSMHRVVAEDFEWRGHQMKKGQFVFVFVAGANRDPHVFADPDRLDLARPQDMNMVFAPGMHFCIGHLLAKMQLGEFFPELVRRFDPELLDKRLDWSPSVGFRGVDSLNIRLHPRPTQ